MIIQSYLSYMYDMKKIAIIGASYLQEPLIQKAKSMGIETHVFAWKTDDVGEKSADYFYPISIVDKEKILEKCIEIGVNGICSIASDLAAITVNYVANRMGLVGNSLECVEVSTNKHSMRRCFEQQGDPSPKSLKVNGIQDLDGIDIEYPVIVKPLDRSGSRGITKIKDSSELESAIERAKQQGFEKAALVEEFVEGNEYSVEYISWNGEHRFLALTCKITTGAPNFIEKGHIEPALVDEETLERVKEIVSHALNSLGVTFGASHSEIKISKEGEIKIIEIGARMGGDFIGSHLVQLSTGFDFVENVIQVAMGNTFTINKKQSRAAGVRFIFDQDDINMLERIKREHPEYIVDEEIHELTNEPVMDSSSRFGYYLLAADKVENLLPYLSNENRDDYE